MGDDGIQRAEELLRAFKGNNYAFGEGALEKVGDYAVELGHKLIVISDVYIRKIGLSNTIIRSIESKGVKVIDEFDGAGPNTPREDVYRLAYLWGTGWRSPSSLPGETTQVLANCTFIRLEDFVDFSRLSLCIALSGIRSNTHGLNLLGDSSYWIIDSN